MSYTAQEIEQELQETFKDGNYNNRTTFGSDFAIANRFGIEAVRDTFRRAFGEWKNDIVYITELTLVMNAYCWHFYEEDNKEYCEQYREYYYQCRDYVYADENPFNEAEQGYFFRCTD